MDVANRMLRNVCMLSGQGRVSHGLTMLCISMVREKQFKLRPTAFTAARLTFPQLSELRKAQGEQAIDALGSSVAGYRECGITRLLDP